MKTIDLDRLSLVTGGTWNPGQTLDACTGLIGKGGEAGGAIGGAIGTGLGLAVSIPAFGLTSVPSSMIGGAAGSGIGMAIGGGAACLAGAGTDLYQQMHTKPAAPAAK
jgi:hypothetical protein